MADEKIKKTNRVLINLSSGCVEVESVETNLKECCKKAEDIAKKLTSNRNPDEWGIS